MNAPKELLLVRLAREFHDIPDAAVVEVVTTLAMLHSGPDWHCVEDEARGLLTTIRRSTRTRNPKARSAASRLRTLSRTTDAPDF